MFRIRHHVAQRILSLVSKSATTLHSTRVSCDPCRPTHNTRPNKHGSQTTHKVLFYNWLGDSICKCIRCNGIISPQPRYVTLISNLLVSPASLAPSHAFLTALPRSVGMGIKPVRLVVVKIVGVGAGGVPPPAPGRGYGGAL